MKYMRRLMMKNLNKKTDVIVIGAGPAGMMSAGIASKRGFNVVIVEKNNRVGRKLMITGKGRCNITNNCDVTEFISSVPCNGKFLYSAINSFTPQDTINFFEENGLKIKTERGNRVFPESDKAVDVVDALSRFIKNQNCKVIRGTVKSLIIENKRLKGVKLENGDSLFSTSVIVACGGKSYPLTGSTGDGYKLAAMAGHSINKLKPSLVPFVVSDLWCEDLQGLSLRNVSIKLKDKIKSKIIYSDFGEMLFTHFGVSGPIILSASSHIKEMQCDRYSLDVDLKPALTLQKLDERLLRDFTKFKNKDLINSLGELLPKKIIPVIIKISGVDVHTKCNSITKEQRENLVKTIKGLTLNIKDFRPIEEAIITSGGVNTKEINPKTMESKLLKGLYFAGEVIDVDAYTGGFNLQIAFSTGHLAGEMISI